MYMKLKYVFNFNVFAAFQTTVAHCVACSKKKRESEENGGKDDGCPGVFFFFFSLARRCSPSTIREPGTGYALRGFFARNPITLASVPRQAASRLFAVT